MKNVFRITKIIATVLCIALIFASTPVDGALTFASSKNVNGKIAANDNTVLISAFGNKGLKSYVGTYVYEKYNESSDGPPTYDRWTIKVKKVKGSKVTLKIEHKIDSGSLMYPFTVYASKTFKAKNNKATFKLNTKTKSGYFEKPEKGKANATIKFKNGKISFKATQTEGNYSIGADRKWVTLKKK